MSRVYTLYIDMDDTLCDYAGAHSEALKNVPKIRYPQSQYDFFRKLNPIKDSIKVFKLLLSDSRFDVYVLTAPSPKNLMSYTEKAAWLLDNIGQEAVDRLFIAPNKSKAIGDFLVDDIEYGKGQEGFTGELIKFGSEKFPDWMSVYEYLTSTVDDDSRKLSYDDANEKLMNVPWKSMPCHQGLSCWCRMILPEVPIEDKDGNEMYVAGSAALSKDHAEYLVRLHNEHIKNNH